MPTSTKKTTCQCAPSTATQSESVKETASIKIVRISGTNIAKIYGLDLTKLEKALKLANRDTLVLSRIDDDNSFAIEFTDHASSLSYAGLQINKETSVDNIITVEYEPDDIAVLVRAQSALEALIRAGVYDDADEYDRAVANIETI